MSALYASELAVILAGAAGMLWLRREGDRLWAEHVSRRVTVTLTIDTTQIDAAMRRMQDSINRMLMPGSEFSLAMGRLSDTVRSFSRVTEGQIAAQEAALADLRAEQGGSTPGDHRDDEGRSGARDEGTA